MSYAANAAKILLSISLALNNPMIPQANSYATNQTLEQKLPDINVFGSSRNTIEPSLLDNLKTRMKIEYRQIMEYLGKKPGEIQDQ